MSWGQLVGAVVGAFLIGLSVMGIAMVAWSETNCADVTSTVVSMYEMTGQQDQVAGHRYALCRS